MKRPDAAFRRPRAETKSAMRASNADRTPAFAALYTMAGGIVGALMAAVPGFIDMLSLPPPLKRAHDDQPGGRRPLAFDTYLRWDGSIGIGVVALSALAVAMLGVSGWLGGKMVYVHGVAVDAEPPPVAPRPTPAPKP